MARREVDDEKKSYSGVFLFAVGLLLVGSVWSVWDDAISRRPWKKYQAEFSMLAYNQKPWRKSRLKKSVWPRTRLTRRSWPP